MPPLQVISARVVARNIHRVTCLDGVPEHLVYAILYIVMSELRLTPRSARLFASTGFSSVLRCVDETPPLIRMTILVCLLSRSGVACRACPPG